MERTGCWSRRSSKQLQCNPYSQRPTAADIAYADRIMDLPNWSTDAELHDCVKTLLPEGLAAAVNPPEFQDNMPRVEAKDNPRRQRRKMLCKMYSGNWRSQRASSRTHSCPPGCFSNPKDVADKSFVSLREAWFDTCLQIRALNRWTQLFGPVWCLLVGLSCHNLLGLAMQALHDNGRASPVAK